MPPSELTSLRAALGSELDAADRFFWAAGASVALSDLVNGSSLGGCLPELHGRSVLVATEDQLTTALALIELDGVARRLVLCPGDLSPEHLSYVIANADVDAIVSDPDAPGLDAYGDALRVACTPTIVPTEVALGGHYQTEWVMLTSGTTGMPKMVVHSLRSLTAAIRVGDNPKNAIIWTTFYDIRRYGGLQVFFRGVLCGGSLVLSSAKEPMGEYLARAGSHRVTHILGTPTHWRFALMNPSARAISPQYVRLSGEIADQSVLDNLRAFYPRARVAHAYASTEGGVGFEVDDGLEGFPSSLIDREGGEVEMKVVDGSLCIRSSRTAFRYVGGEAQPLRDADGFIDSGDIVERRGDRYYFVGRRGGIINVGGLKVHPEEVEGVINRHPEVRASLVKSRRNPIMGAIVVADVVLRGEAANANAGERAAAVKREILQTCRDALAEYKVPASIRFVAALDVGPSGKLNRHHA